MSRVYIFIVSFAPDALWLTFCLRSINKYAKGFAGVVVAYPDRDDAVMRPICREHGAEPKPVPEPLPPKAHLYHNVTKTRGDLHCPDATHILHIDSDCIVTREIKPDDYFHEGKPILIRRLWKDAADAICWKDPVERALGMQTEYETMARAGLIYNASTYSAVRTNVEQKHNMPFETYVLQQKPTFPYGYCEFNTLGAYVLAKTPGMYHIITTPEETVGENPILQLWSNSGNIDEIKEWLEETLTVGLQRPPPPPTPMNEARRKMMGL